MSAKPAVRPSARRRAREFVLQGIYEWQLSGNAPDAVKAELKTANGFARTDAVFFDAPWDGVMRELDNLVKASEPLLDRRAADLSPIERSIIAIGAWELKHRPDIPHRVVINEAVELAKSYGGTDGHKYVNGVLDKAAADLRPVEVNAARNKR